MGIPAYQRSPFVEAAIESVLAQTFTDWHLLISEDGPAGGELEAAVRPYLADPRIEYRATGERLGAAGNHSVVLERGSAPFVAILNHDDRWDSEFLARRVDFLERHTDAAVVFSGNTEIDERGEELKRSRLRLAERVHQPDEFLPLLLRRNVISMPTLVALRRAYEAVGPRFDPQWRFLYDYDMWLRLAVRFGFGYLHVWDAAYRRHDEQMTYSQHGWGEEWLRFLPHANAIVPERLRMSRREMRRRRSHAFLSAALDALETGDRRSALRHVRAAIRTYSLRALDPRTPAVLIVSALGARSRRALARLRWQVHRRAVRVHFRTRW